MRGFLALWMSLPPEVGEAFELAHARDHLADHLGYLGPDGILWARRHHRGKGTLPPYFAFYGMSSLDVLTDAANAACRVPMSDAFRPIRAQFRDRIGHHCRLLASAGTGTGGSVATFVAEVASADLAAGAARPLVDALVERAPLTAAHVGIVDWNVPASVGQPLPVRPAGAPDLVVLVVEGFDRWRLAAEVDAVAATLCSSGIATRVTGWGHYALSCALRHDELPQWVRYPPAQTRPR